MIMADRSSTTNTYYIIRFLEYEEDYSCIVIGKKHARAYRNFQNEIYSIQIDEGTVIYEKGTKPQPCLMCGGYDEWYRMTDNGTLFKKIESDNLDSVKLLLEIL